MPEPARSSEKISRQAPSSALELGDLELGVLGRLGDGRCDGPRAEVGRVGVAGDAAAVALGAHEHVEALALGVPGDERVAPVDGVVPAGVGLEHELAALPAHQVARRGDADPLPRVGVRHAGVEEVPAPVMADHAARPRREVVERAGRTGAERVREHVPAAEVARAGVADRRVVVTQLGVAQRARRLQVEDVDVLAVAGEPEVPQPVVGQAQRHGAGILPAVANAGAAAPPGVASWHPCEPGGGSPPGGWRSSCRRTRSWS